jgi:hypothetical protein
MIKIRNSILISILAILMLSVFSGCSYSFGMASSSFGGNIDKSYVTFNEEDRKSWQFTEGETIVLDYKTTVDKGVLHLNMTGPDKEELWSVNLTKGESGTVEIPVKKTGTYVLTMKGEETGGGMHIKISKK